MNDSKTRKIRKKLGKLEKSIQDFIKEKDKYDHPENDRFNKYNNRFNEAVEIAVTLKEQEKIQEAFRKYKEALNWGGAIIDLHRRIEGRRADPRYYKIRNILWIITGILLIIAFGILPLGASFDITWFVIGIWIAIGFVACLFIYNTFRSSSKKPENKK